MSQTRIKRRIRRGRSRGGGYCANLLSRKEQLRKTHGTGAHKKLSKSQKLGYQACRLIFARKSFAEARRNRIILPAAYPGPATTATLEAMKTSSMPTAAKKYITAVSNSSEDLERNSVMFNANQTNKTQFDRTNRTIANNFINATESIPLPVKQQVSSVAKVVLTTADAMEKQGVHPDNIKKKLKQKFKRSLTWGDVFDRTGLRTGSIKQHDGKWRNIGTNAAVRAGLTAKDILQYTRSKPRTQSEIRTEHMLEMERTFGKNWRDPLPDDPEDEKFLIRLRNKY